MAVNNYRNSAGSGAASRTIAIHPPVSGRDSSVLPAGNNGALGPSAAFTPTATFQRGSSFYGNSRRPGAVAATNEASSIHQSGLCRDRTAVGGSIFDADDVNIDRNTYQVIGQCVYILTEAEARVANAAAGANNAGERRADMQGWEQHVRQPPLSTPVSMNNIPPVSSGTARSTGAMLPSSNDNATSSRIPVSLVASSSQSRAPVPTVLSRDDALRASAQRRASVIVHHQAMPPAAALRKVSAGNYSGGSGDSTNNNVKMNSPSFQSSATNTNSNSHHRARHQPYNQLQQPPHVQQAAKPGFVMVADSTHTGAGEIYPASSAIAPVLPVRLGKPQVMSTNDDVAVVFKKPFSSVSSNPPQQRVAEKNIRRHTSSSSSEHQHHRYRGRKQRVGPDGEGGVVDAVAASDDDDFENAVIIGADDDEFNVLPSSSTSKPNSKYGKSVSPLPPQLPPKQRRHRHSSTDGGHTSVSDAFVATVNEIQTLHGLCGPGSSPVDVDGTSSSFPHVASDNSSRTRS